MSLNGLRTVERSKRAPPCLNFRKTRSTTISQGPPPLSDGGHRGKILLRMGVSVFRTTQGLTLTPTLTLSHKSCAK